MGRLGFNWLLEDSLRKTAATELGVTVTVLKDSGGCLKIWYSKP